MKNKSDNTTADPSQRNRFKTLSIDKSKNIDKIKRHLPKKALKQGGRIFMERSH